VVSFRGILPFFSYPELSEEHTKKKLTNMQLPVGPDHTKNILTVNGGGVTVPNFSMTSGEVLAFPLVVEYIYLYICKGKVIPVQATEALGVVRG
jgi:hypothetical protein